MKEIVSAVTSKGHVTIPVEVRRHLGVGMPDRIAFVIDAEGQVRLRPARLTLADLRGIVPPLPGRETVDFEDQIDEAMGEETDRIVRSLEGR